LTIEKYWNNLGKEYREIKYNYISMEDFYQYLKDSQLAKSTIANHKRQLEYFVSLGGELHGSEKDIIAFIKKNYYEGSQTKEIISSVSKYRTYNELSNTMIRQALKKLLKLLQKNNKKEQLK